MRTIRSFLCDRHDLLQELLFTWHHLLSVIPIREILKLASDLMNIVSENYFLLRKATFIYFLLALLHIIKELIQDDQEKKEANIKKNITLFFTYH